MKANPGHLGLYALLFSSEGLAHDISGDASCVPALAAFPKALLVSVHAEYSGVLPLHLSDVARLACRTAKEVSSKEDLDSMCWWQ